MIRQTAARVSEAVKVLTEIANAPDQCGSTVLKISAKALLERWEWEDERDALSESQMNICNSDKQG